MGKLNKYSFFRKVIALFSSLISAFMLLYLFKNITDDPYIEIGSYSTLVKIISLFYVIVPGLLAFGLFRRKFWSIYVYTIFLIGTYILAFDIIGDAHRGCYISQTPDYGHMIFIFCFAILPTVIGIILFRYCDKILNK